MIADTPAYSPRPLPLRMPRVCLVVAGGDATEMVDKAEAVVRDNPLLEFRLDYLRQPGAALPRIRRFMELHSECIAIATCRRAKNGGRFRGTVAAQIEMLLKARNADCQILDVELDSAQAMKFTEYQRLRSKGALVLSFHDFRGTRKLDETF